MTMQVSKGEFDRRVKLLEQKVQSSTNDLINRLQAESEAFIEKLRNTQLDIDALKEEIENIDPDNPELDSILNNFIKGYNNFASNTLRINDVFDADGQFDGSRIRPLSIETAALSVGTRSQQLALNGIEFRVLPYTKSSSGSDRNGYIQIVSSQHTKSGANFTGNSLAGYIFHYGYGTDTNAIIYKINEKQELLTSTDKYYIYAQFTTSNSSVYEKVNNIDIVYFYSYIEKLYTYSNPNYSRVYVDGDSYSHYDSNVDYYVVQGDNLANAEINSKNDFLRKINDLYTITEVEVSSFTQGEDYYYFSEKITNVLVKEESEEPRAGVQYYIKSKLSLPTFNSSIDYYINKTEDIITNTSTTEGNAQEATILISQNQIQTKDNSYPNKLTVKLGYIGQEMSTTNGRYERKVDMTYGQTTIDGRLITTGRIEGNNCSFDLDTGEISGVVSYGLTTAQLGSALNTIYGTATDAKNAFDNLEIGGRNLLPTTGYWEQGSASTNSSMAGKSWEECKISSTERLRLINTMALTSNTKYTISINSSYFYELELFNTSNKLIGYVDGWKNTVYTFDTGSNVGYVAFLVRKNDSSNITPSEIGDALIKLEKGNKATDWSPAPEDMEEGGWVSKSKVLYYRNTSNSIPSIPTLDSSTQTIVYIKSGITWTDDINSLAPNKNNTTNFWIYKCQISYKEKDSKVKDFSCTNAVYDDAMTTNLIAMQGSTTIAGGLILSSKIIVKDENNANNCAILNGTDEYAFYAGNQSHDSAPVYIKRNGTAKFGNLFFNINNISGNELDQGLFSINLTTNLPNNIDLSFGRIFTYKNTYNPETLFPETISSTMSSNVTIISEDDTGEFTAYTDINSRFIITDISFNYVFTQTSPNGTSSGAGATIYLYIGNYEIAIKNIPFKGGATSYTTSDSFIDNGEYEFHDINNNGYLSNSYPNYGLKVKFVSNTSNNEIYTIKLTNIKFNVKSTMNLSFKGFHIYRNGIYYYVNKTNYFILYDKNNKLKCLNTLGI